MVSDQDAIAVVEALSREGLRNLRLESRVYLLEKLVEWCKPDEHSPPEHWAAYRACFQSDAKGESNG